MTAPSSPKSPRDMRRPALPPTVAWRLKLARAAMIWERVWPALWPAFALIGTFLVLSFLDLWRFVPSQIQALSLFAVAFASAFLLWRNLTRTKLPKRREGLRRLETESGLEHRPLSSFDDLPAASANDPAAQKLWRTHRARLADKIKHVGLVLPRTDAEKRDPYALRLLIVLALGVSLLIAGSQWGDRLRDAIAPFLGPAVPADAQVDAWIEPPAYTGHPIITLSGRAPAEGGIETIEVPVGSTLVARFAGFPGRPAVKATPLDANGTRGTALVEPKDGALEGRLTIDGASRATITYRGKDLGTWDLAVRADAPPMIELASPPQATATASLRFSYVIADDYGVTAVRAHLTLPPRTEDEANALASRDLAGITPDYRAVWPQPGTPFEVALPQPIARPGVSEETALENLAAHPWAGEDVIVQLSAEDGAGQENFSGDMRITLPERVFVDPLARAVIEQRKYLARNPEDVFTVATALDALTAAPEGFIDDHVVYLTLRAAFWRLAHHPRPDDVRDAYDMLWDVALRIEDGDLSESLKRLRQVQRMLADALSRNAPAEEIRQLMAQLRAALDQYMAELMQQSDQMAGDPNAQTMEAEDLNSLLRSIQQMAELGAHDQARQMLAELNQILENLRPSAGNGNGRNGPPSPQEQALNEALGDLSEIIGKQRGLLDETYRNTDAAAEQSASRTAQMREAFRRAFRDTGPLNLLKQRDGSLGDFTNTRPSQDEFGGSELLRKLMREGNDDGINGGGGETDNAQRIVDPEQAENARLLAEQQDALRKLLDELTQTLAQTGLDTPESLSEAAGSMTGSTSDLQVPNFDDALKDQQAALDQLRRGAEQMAQDLMQRQGRQSSSGMAQSDPRAGNQATQTGSNPAIDKTELQRAREILDELRRRAGERSRPRFELDYYERLLQQF